MRAISVTIFALYYSAMLALSCASTLKKPAAPETEGFIDNDTLFVRGQGETKIFEKPLNPLAAEYAAKAEARIDAGLKVPEICRGPVAACGGASRSTALGKQLQDEVKRAKPVHTECIRLAAAEPRFSCEVWYKIQKKGLKRECGDAAELTVAAGCGY